MPYFLEPSDLWSLIKNLRAFYHVLLPLIKENISLWILPSHLFDYLESKFILFDSNFHFIFMRKREDSKDRWYYAKVLIPWINHNTNPLNPILVDDFHLLLKRKLLISKVKYPSLFDIRAKFNQSSTSSCFK